MALFFIWNNSAVIQCESKQNSNTKLHTPCSLPHLLQPKLHPEALPTSQLTHTPSPRPNSTHKPSVCSDRNHAEPGPRLQPGYNYVLLHILLKGGVLGAVGGGGGIKTKQKRITASLKIYWERSSQLTPYMQPSYPQREACFSFHIFQGVWFPQGSKQLTFKKKKKCMR